VEIGKLENWEIGELNRELRTFLNYKTFNFLRLGMVKK